MLKRDERIKTLKETDRWADGRSPYGLPKVRVIKISTKKIKKEKTADEAAPGTAPVADAKAAAGGKAGAKPAAAAAKPAAANIITESRIVRSIPSPFAVIGMIGKY